jgi:hypothetical protein
LDFPWGSVAAIWPGAPWCKPSVSEWKSWRRRKRLACERKRPYRIIKLADGSELSCHALMIATGVQWRRLEAPGIARLQGAGIYYGGGATEAHVL